ncbi:protoporphyrinogen oxidase [Sutcliffiella cohnii]|uniref:protoporphyrinogen oxidase n=1 Tax=Sutcliffiella cohnii TaxID=33932 RepID=UPI002E1DE97D|nr:protoporphyrinogen oxidase [Sutcliffiella cohnii]MED4016785.1 protoporphyrinogen oxidase [Sutcliffiella cohnii]
MSEEKKKVVIVGGGITGLSAAYYLQKEIEANKLPISITLVESTSRLGGKVQTVSKDGYIIEKGPDSFLARKESASRLIKELGLEKKKVRNTSGTSFILLKGKLYPIPDGAVMGIPTKMSPFVTTGLFSPLGKVRAAGDLILPTSKEKGDQSVGSFFRRRFGGEVVENLIEPLLSGIYAGDIDQLSLQATFPQFQKVEQKHRSLILGMKQTMPPTPKKKVGMFQTLTTGLQKMIDTLEEKLHDVQILRTIKVLNIDKTEKGYCLKLSNGDAIKCDSVIVTTPHSVTASMFESLPSMHNLEKMPSTSVATVALGFDESAIQEKMSGTGFVVSRNSDFSITACTWTHRKWPHTAPKGKVLLRCYVGRVGEEAIVEQSDTIIKRVVMDDLKKIMNITQEPDFALITRWKKAMPQYNVGHKDRIKEVKDSLGKVMPGVILAGSSYEGLGVPDCIDQGEEAVKLVLSHLATT